MKCHAAECMHSDGTCGVKGGCKIRADLARAEAHALGCIEREAAVRAELADMEREADKGARYHAELIVEIESVKQLNAKVASLRAELAAARELCGHLADSLSSEHGAFLADSKHIACTACVLIAEARAEAAKEGER